MTTSTATASRSISEHLAPEALARALRQLGSAASLAQMHELYAPLLVAQPREDVHLQTDLRYGEDDRHQLDLYLPRGKAPEQGWPVLVVLHGGGFIRGDKSQRANFGWHFAREGWAVVVPNYRLAPTHRWPAGAQDVVSVWNWLRAQAQDGHHDLDPEAIVLLGESAGAAHVAAAALLRRLQPQDWCPAGVVLLSGPSHPRLERLTRDTFGIASPDPRNDACFGTDDPEALATMGVLENIDAAPLPLLIGFAERDLPQMQVQAGVMFERLVVRHGFRPELLIVRDHNHFSQCMAVGTGDQTLAAPLRDFLKRCTGR